MNLKQSYDHLLRIFADFFGRECSDLGLRCWFMGQPNSRFVKYVHIFLDNSEIPLAWISNNLIALGLVGGATETLILLTSILLIITSQLLSLFAYLLGGFT